MEEEKKEIIDEITVNNEESMNDVENSVQENDIIKNDVKENETKKESSNVKSIVIILILFIILVGAGVYGLFLVSKEESNSNKDNNNNNNNNEITDNNIQEEVPTFNDDVVDDVDDDNVEIENNIINIYQKGYAENGPIAFTYECNSENCDIKVTDKGFILYDEEVVKYREMTSYEYEQINNSEISPIGSKLDMDGFDIINPIYNKNNVTFKVNYEEIEYEIYEFQHMYLVDKNIYGIENDCIIKEENYIISDDFIITPFMFLYDYKKNIVVGLSEALSSRYLQKYEKIGKFHVFLIATGEDFSPYYNIYDENYNTMHFTKDDYGFYIDNDKIYMMVADKNNSYIMKMVVYDDKNNKLEYTNTGKTPIFIYNDRYVYLDEDNNLKSENIVGNGEIYEYNVKVDNFEPSSYVVYHNNGHQLIYDDYTVVDNADFEIFRKNQNISDEDMNKVKTCSKNSDECEFWFIRIGYVINFDNNGKFISKEYYLYMV